MGIKGLHKALSFCTKKDNLRNYRNAIVAVDTSSWMHKSVYSISEKFVEATDQGIIDPGCVRVSARYIVGRCKELIEVFGIRAVYLVMDGTRIPLKADESQDRDQKRREHLEEARRLKRSGQRWKAEDKYKACIRIKDAFTAEVIREVERAFSNYGRVFFVHSPHEADSQLARLVLDGVASAVITEDSDVLVYSAASHKAFPILFKLDRKTGDCDSITMDWLISPSERDTQKAVSSKNTLEFILRRFASKQLKTPGLGVRLFVQGCILSGCDYRKNIEGIGTTNAFKLVSENAFRGASERFRKILESLPKKVKQKIDLKEHEEILSKSEAVFFYHLVLHKDRKIRPLLPPRLSQDDKTENHYTDHYPVMSRFGGDWSFLGTIDYSNPTNSESSKESSIAHIERPKESSILNPSNKRDPPSILPNKPQIFHNPYKKQRHDDNNRSLPLTERSINTHIIYRDGTATKKTPTKTGGIARFLVNTEDPRYARRSFPSTTTRTGSRPLRCSASSSFRLSKKSAAQSFFDKRPSKKPKATVERKFEYQAFAYPSFDEEPPSKSGINMFDKFKNNNEHEVFDLTQSHAFDDDDDSDNDEPPVNTAQNDDSEDQLETVRTNSNIPSGDAIGDSRIDDDEREKRPKIQIATSKYFSTKQSDPRRITLDSTTASPPRLGVVCDTTQTTDDDDVVSSPEIEKRNPQCNKNDRRRLDDECIDDPEEEELGFRFGSNLRRTIASERQPTSRACPKGSIGSFFKRQEQFANELKKNNPSQTTTKASKNRHDDFFSPEKYAAKKPITRASSDAFHRSSLFSQLNFQKNLSQSAEDYLWNGSP